MRKIFILLFCMVISGLLFACGSENMEKDVKATFVGIIEEIHSSGTAYVSVIEVNDNKISGTVDINILANAEETFQVGDKVRVGYDGTTMEVAPVRISTITLEKVK
ncbi:hypothetical protein [Sporosarcina cascadiensis]|uniref:hypothetical protein n=1 Tax=Sporosarcina cascadiensis TaxID=2660747 RepID=UPI00129AAA5B|nr:hypothetical protein [Sporosarcina cascadiensis]